MVFNVHFAKYIQFSCYIGKISEIFIKKGSFYILFGLGQEDLAKRKVAQTLRRKLMSCTKLQVIYKIAERFQTSPKIKTSFAHAKKVLSKLNKSNH
ncbi:hypothetical protein CIB87_12680 [Priestia megaterium]|uniref:Uncharacterized protein n=1 Tax=Priestia megaterium TaxID=1404 RepID=A0AA86IFA7_PRIMG|nr:hypothetical protein CIB87_12680 [Priestia megaterium]